MTDHGNKDGTPGGSAPVEEDLLGPELRRILGSLPRELTPERDLSEEIASLTWESLPTTRPDVDVAATKKAPRAAWWRVAHVQLAAAAVALIVVTSVTTTYLVRRQAESALDAPATVATATSEAESGTPVRFTGYAVVERDYAEAISDLTETLEAERYRLAPETVQLIEENLRIIDQAIEQSLAALRDAPESLPLQQAVMTSYERKLDFLRRAAAITADG